MFSLEHHHFPSATLIAGVDEVGRGSWAGPVVAAAVVFDQAIVFEEKTIFDQGMVNQGAPGFLHLIADSKVLTAAKRDIVRRILETMPGVYVGIGVGTVEEIDTHNILQATFIAMGRAIRALPIECNGVLVDGVHKIHDLNKPPQVAIVHGDQLSRSIGAASIIAKTYRDRLMNDLHQSYPWFGWDKNMGYGTKKHQAGLTSFGPTPHHRRTFKPVAALLHQ